MNIIAKTSGGYFIEATNDEVVAILTATGLKPENGDKIPAGTTSEIPNSKLANSPIPAVTVPFNIKLSRILIVSIIIPASGPIAKAPTSTATSLRSIS